MRRPNRVGFVGVQAQTNQIGGECEIPFEIEYCTLSNQLSAIGSVDKNIATLEHELRAIFVDDVQIFQIA